MSVDISMAPYRQKWQPGSTTFAVFDMDPAKIRDSFRIRIVCADSIPFGSDGL